MDAWTVVKIKGSKPRRERWTREQVGMVVDAAADAGDTVLASFVQLMYETAQRPSDILEVSTWFQDRGQWYIDLAQSKTGSEVIVPFSDKAMALCGNPEPGSRRNLLGTKVTLDALRVRFNKLRKVLGIDSSIQLRDLRRTAITEMSERGATDDEMRTVSGHKDSAMLPVYSVPTRRKAQAMFDRRFVEWQT